MLQRVRSFFVRESMCCNCQFTGEIRMLPCQEDGMIYLCLSALIKRLISAQGRIAPIMPGTIFPRGNRWRGPSGPSPCRVRSRWMFLRV